MIQDYDLCIIGGGINGAGIARDAAGRGLRVLLLEKGDLANGTSSASTSIIHGGLRYLETYEFGLVRRSLKEREVLMSIAPHLVHPMTFVIPHGKGQRPYKVVGAGLFLYDNLAKRKKLQKSYAEKLEGHYYGVPLKEEYKKGFSYADCRTTDSRLVVVNAMDAAMHGAEIKTRTECINLREHGGRWHITMKEGNSVSTAGAKAVINAGGPWVRNIIDQSELAMADVPNISHIKGSHIIVPRQYDGGHAYTLQQPDGRIVFLIPYEDDLTLIGTTDEKFEGDLNDIRITHEEVEYLCAALNRVLKKSISEKDVLWSYSGVRTAPQPPENKKLSSVSREHQILLHENMGAPLISVFGGKLTSYRYLAEEVVDVLQKEIGRDEEAWTSTAVLPGGDIPNEDFELFAGKKQKEYHWLPAELVQRYARSYGTRMDHFLSGAKTVKDLGKHYGHHIYEAEIFYLAKHEWARDVEDILWRRSKLGMKVDEKTMEKLEKALPKIIDKAMP